MHLRCPQCRNAVELVDEVEWQGISCPSCGTDLSLVNLKTTTYSPTDARQIAHFQLLEQVGLGGFGAVWRAKDLELDRIVAVKLPRKDQLAPHETEQFLREARAAAQLRHPNIVTIHEVGREDTTVFIVSDFIFGVTLADRLRHQRMAPLDAAQLLGIVCEAVHHAHCKGVVHRDLKPSNILLDREGQPHVTDFGLAKRDGGEITMTVEGHILGTPAYMSPEQARGDGHCADARSDVYSLGVVLFEMVTGRLPFTGSPRLLTMQILQDEPPRLRSFDRSIPLDLETICLKCLAKEPSRRFQTARELATDLQRFLQREPIAARPVGRLEKLWQSCRRQPLVASLLCTVALLASIVVAGVLTRPWTTDSPAIDAMTPDSDAVAPLPDVTVVVDPRPEVDLSEVPRPTFTVRVQGAQPGVMPQWQFIDIPSMLSITQHGAAYGLRQQYISPELVFQVEYIGDNPHGETVEIRGSASVYTNRGTFASPFSIAIKLPGD